ncbi:hypothetical protein STTU_p0009 (plasmid) [Streptomyces sp. Tu6071]|nr:hypothetical protein STTU_p0009 [Streptomyces sp. Tu6071]
MRNLHGVQVTNRGWMSIFVSSISYTATVKASSGRGDRRAVADGSAHRA